LKTLKTLLKYLLVGIIFYFLFRSLFLNWSEVQRLNIRLNLYYTFAALAAVMMAWIVSAWCWGRVLNAFKSPIPYSDVFIIYFKSNLGKYLPGKVWQIVGSTYYAKTKGVPEGIALTTSLIGQAYSVLSGLSLFAVTMIAGLPGKSIIESQYLKWSAAPVLVFLLVIAVRPELGQPLMNRIMKILRRPTAEIHLPIGRAIELFFDYLVCWFIFGLGLWLFAKALTDTPLSLYIGLTAANAIAVAIGFIALFAPGGLGVREGVMALFLSTIPGFPAPLPSAVAIGYRIIITVAEVIAFGLTWVVQWMQKK
jgi:glycosyltransferase 2 family protein